MYNNFFILMILILLSIYLMISKLNQKKERIDYSIFYKSFENLKNIYNRDTKEMLCLPYYSNSQLKENTKNLFLKVVMLLNSKDKIKIQSSSLISESMKNNILEKLDNLSILPIKKVISVDIHFIQNKNINATIRSEILDGQNTNKEVEDECEIINNNNVLVLNNIYAKFIRTEFGNLVTELIANKEEF